MQEKILVAMSGGIDSTVSAILLKEQGFDVIGATIIMHEYSDIHVTDAKKICDILGIENIIIDAKENFNNIVLKNFAQEYLLGKTPNPCVLCNRELKWKSIIDLANSLNINKIATGHYARIKYENGIYRLFKGKNEAKDQTYMLWRLPQDYLARTIFPLGDIHSKAEVRDIAKKHNIPSFEKSDSQDICFIPDNDYRRFLKGFDNTINSINRGDIILNEKKIGEHIGYPFYTIGQRRGLGIAYKQPLYVKEIDAVNNRLIVAVADDLLCDGLQANNVNIINKNSFFSESSKNIIAKIRYKDAGKSVTYEFKDNILKVFFKESRKSVTPGQSVVLYNGDELIGGGIIM